MAEKHEIKWSLSDPGMDLLERAGLAGLYMALQAATDAGHDLSPLKWTEDDLTNDSVTVRWEGPAKPAFRKLMEWAWQVRDGVIYLPAIHGDRERTQWWLRVPVHNGILSTFLQHINVQPRLDFESRVVALSEEKQISVGFASPAERVDDPERGTNPKTGRLHKKKIPTQTLYPVKQCEELFDKQSGQFKKKLIQLSNWIYPGIAGRYKDEQSWEGPAHEALLLMLAPTVCMYQRLQGKGNNTVLVISDIRDLDDFAATRRLLNLDADYTDVASLGDAGLQFHAEYATRNPRRQLASGCRVVAMGYVGYYEGQSIRKSVLDVSPVPAAVQRYRLLYRELPNVFVSLRAEPNPDESKPASAPKKSRGRPGDTKQENSTKSPTPSGFIKLPGLRGRVAENLVNHRPWYENLTMPLVWDHDEMERQRKKQPGTSIDSLWFQSVCYQRSKLMKLIQEDDLWDSEAERVFVEAFWETLDSLYKIEAIATFRGGSRTENERFDDLNEDIRRRLMRAKTRPLLRSEIMELIAKAGRQKSIGNHPAAIWRLVDHPDHWRKGRDLALLALASHRKKKDRENSSSSSSTTKGN